MNLIDFDPVWFKFQSNIKEYDTAVALPWHFCSMCTNLKPFSGSENTKISIVTSNICFSKKKNHGRGRIVYSN